MHGDVIGDQTTASQVSRLDEAPTHWLTGTAAPCTSVFTPYYVEAPIPDVGDPATGVADDDSLWWRHERLHRAVRRDFPARHGSFAADHDALEASFLEASADVGTDPQARERFGRECFERADAARTEWLAAVEATRSRPWRRPLASLRWWRYDRQVGLRQRRGTEDPAQRE